ncbi:MAG: PKD domain-containing protein [Winogradskyella sp.]|uniref:T9SS type B sorting domain-containing protein n=1 Tax=Winogradskyella sp. TaxID=1883156 RepID=UPI000F3F84BF|nr:T9SS type B sorting domain-containing protein [Winogradskyella sp.]RNC87061.1 MAG: PKD domain-containing protein [Winogradskyella sp.]
MLKNLLLLILIIFLNTSVFSQGEHNVWYFGENAGIDFNTNVPVALLNGQIDTVEGSSIISDANGSLLFYTDGVTVWNKNHQVMLNGNDLNGNESSTHSALIVSKPNDPDIYYIFTVDDLVGPDGLQYSEVDMSLDFGLGGVTANKNIMLHTPTTEKLVAVKNANNDGLWVISHKSNSNEFIAYSVSSSGINTTPVISAVGTLVFSSNWDNYPIGQIKISPDGTKLAVARATGLSEVQLFDFNTSTGIVSNPVTLFDTPDANETFSTSVYGVEFSPNSQVLYVSIRGISVFQYNLLAGSSTDIIDSQLPVSIGTTQNAALQLGPDGKIYVAKFQSLYLDAINNPNIVGTGCDYQSNDLYLEGRRCLLGLPSFSPVLFEISFQTQSNCLGEPTQFNAAISQNYDSLTWDFGDGTTSEDENPTHTYTSAGIYTIELTVISNGQSFNYSEDILISNIDASISFTDTSFCGLSDGSIVISELLSNTNYVITYDYQGTPSSLNLQSDASGNVEITGLPFGSYDNIVVTEDATGCEDTLGQIIIDEPDFILSFTASDPSSCSSEDGEIVISDLVPNQSYVVDYFYNSVLVQDIYTADSNGEILIIGLSSGQYENIMVVDTVLSCTDGIGLLELESTQLDASISFTDASFCGLSDGSIVISELLSNTNYVITYDYQGTPVSLNLQSDASGNVEITGLPFGSYDNIVVTEDATGCEDTLGQIIIDEPDFILSFTASDPSSCSSEDGEIVISDLVPNQSYVVDYFYNSVLVQDIYTADSNGEILIIGLSSGQYENIMVVDTVLSCTDGIGLLELESTQLDASISFTDASFCGLSDGSIVISELLSNTNYVITYDYQGTPVSLNLQSDASGNAEITGLPFGSYDNIVVTEDATGCEDTLGQVIIDCLQNVEEDCFRIKKFFTPNNDGYNDFWYLDTLSDCSYIVFIYDRYGKLLTSLNPSKPYWNGTYNGVNMPTNDYWFLVNYKTIDGLLKSYSSHFTLKR